MHFQQNPLPWRANVCHYSTIHRVFIVPRPPNRIEARTCAFVKRKKRNNRNRSQSIRLPLPRTPSTDLPPTQRSYRRRDREIILRRLVSVPHCVRSRLVDAFERFFTIRAILHRYRPTISDNFTSTCLIQISISSSRVALPISLTLFASNTMGKFYRACRFSYARNIDESLLFFCYFIQSSLN